MAPLQLGIVNKQAADEMDGGETYYDSEDYGEEEESGQACAKIGQTRLGEDR